MKFKENIKKSFKKAKKDLNAVKENITEWIRYLNFKSNDLDSRIGLLELRIAKLEEIIENRIEVEH